MKKIDIIVPCHNEAGNIEKFLIEFDDTLKGMQYNFGFIFINDGSSDNTIEILREVALKDERISVIDFSRNFGKEAAMLAGLDYSTGDASIIVDADLEMPLKYIIDLLKAWESGYKLVLTYRSNRKKGLSSSFASKFYDVYNDISDSKILNDALDFQLMDHELVMVMKSMREKTRFLKGLTGYLGYNYKVIPVEMVTRTYGKSSFSGYKTLFGYAFKSIAAHSVVPLRIAMNMGILIGVIALFYMTYVFISTLAFGNPISGWASTVVIMLFLFATVLFTLGIIGYYLGKIYEEVKGRPNYIIDSIIKKNKD
jgi:glycosyltransferase involved in cell wall biosynthesis